MAARTHRFSLPKVPRWWLEAWTWFTVPCAYLDMTGCPDVVPRAVCAPVTNTWVAAAVSSFPGESQMLFISWGLSPIVAALASAILAAGCQTAMRRVLPTRVHPGVVGAFVLISAALTFAVVLVAVAVMFKTSPWLILRGMFEG